MKKIQRVKSNQKKKILDHPVLHLKKVVEDQNRKIRDLGIEIAVLRGLLSRTVRLLAKLDIDKIRKPKLVK